MTKHLPYTKQRSYRVDLTNRELQTQQETLISFRSRPLQTTAATLLASIHHLPHTAWLTEGAGRSRKLT
jgi:hypothetical protein